MADIEATGWVTAVSASLTIIAQVAQAMWANRKGKWRDPQMRKIAECMDHIDKAMESLSERFDRIEARLERVERAQRIRGAPLDDTEAGDMP